jgi:hypothetical protein
MVQAIQQKMDQATEERIDSTTDLIKLHSAQLQITQNSQFPLAITPSPKRRRPSKTTTPRNPQITEASTRAECVAVRVVPYTSACRSSCPCTCHSQARAATPIFINRVMGRLFIAYGGVPLMSPKCDLEECQTSQVPMATVEFWFPLGFCWSQVVQLRIGYRPNLGPQFSLRTFRQVPDSAQCVNYTMDGNIEGLKDLFKRGLASPLDVSSTRGYTLLRVSGRLIAKTAIGLCINDSLVVGGLCQAIFDCQILVEAGVDLDYRRVHFNQSRSRHY